MSVINMMTVSWAWIAAWVFLGAVMTVLACIVLAEHSQRHHHARHRNTQHSAPQAHEQISPDETSHEHLRHAA